MDNSRAQFALSTVHHCCCHSSSSSSSIIFVFRDEELGWTGQMTGGMDGKEDDHHHRTDRHLKYYISRQDSSRLTMRDLHWLVGIGFK
jgi:hypothetical protein